MMVMGTIGLSYAKLTSANEEGEKQMHLKEVKEVGSSLEVHITDKGKVLIRGAKVTAVNGAVITAHVGWDNAVLNWNIVTNASTKFIKRSSISEVSVGDFISFQGMLDSTVASPLTVKADVVKNWSEQRKNASFKGIVTSINASNQSFVIASDNNQATTITVYTSSSTKIEKGDAMGVFADLAVNQTVTVKGIYSSQTGRLDATQVKIHLSGDVPKTTLEGKVKTLPGAAAPTMFVVTAGNIDYTVNVLTDTSVLNVLWLKTSLGLIKVNDKIRVYGAITGTAVDATVIRDTML